MAKRWTEDNKFRKMREVEVLACEALAELGEIPEEAAKVIREKADLDGAKLNEIEKATNHEVVTF